MPTSICIFLSITVVSAISIVGVLVIVHKIALEIEQDESFKAIISQDLPVKPM